MLDLLKMFLSDTLFTLIVPGIFVGFGLLVVAQFVPDILKQYKVPAQLGGIVLILFFTFQSGRYNEYTKWRLEQSTLQSEIALYKSRSVEITETVLTKYVDRVRVVEKIKEVPVNVYVTEKADQLCFISPSTSTNIRMFLDAASEGKLPQSAIVIDGDTVKAK
jgi:hypothetical protein